MFKNNILYGLIGLLAGLIIGFIVANNINRHAPERAPQAASNSAAPRTNKSAGATASDNSTGDNQPPAPTDEEIRGAIAKADAKPEDTTLQKNFGLVLYRYTSQIQDPRYLPDVARLLKRAQAADPKDRDLTVQLGNVLFDIGQTSDPEKFAEAREFYLKALQSKPDDVDVRTDLGLTYYLGRPSDPQRAIVEYRKALRLNPRDERALQSLANALISTGNYTEAQQRIEELQGVNPQHEALSNLRAQLAQSKNAAGQK